MKKILKYNDMKKWDVILANPPFNLGEKMLAKWFDLADTICTVQPSTWLLGKKKTKSICSHLDNGEFNADIESINGSEYFDAAIAGRITINHFIQQNNSTHHNSTYILFDGKKYDKCSEITLTSNDSLLTEFKNIVEPLYLNDNLQNYIKSIPNVHVFGNAPVEYNPDDNWWIFRITRYSVVHDRHTNWCITYKKMLDVYKFKDIKNKKEGKNIFLKYYIPFTNQQTAMNIINYIQTDFCRGCLYLIQTSPELGRGECKCIPYFDFSDTVFSKTPSEIDDYLFAKYNISNEIRKHIEKLLPDYYNIRKGRD